MTLRNIKFLIDIFIILAEYLKHIIRTKLCMSMV